MKDYQTHSVAEILIRSNSNISILAYSPQPISYLLILLHSGISISLCYYVAIHSLHANLIFIDIFTLSFLAIAIPLINDVQIHLNES